MIGSPHVFTNIYFLVLRCRKRKFYWSKKAVFRFENLNKYYKLKFYKCSLTSQKCIEVSIHSVSLRKLPPPVKSSSLKTTFLFRFPSFYPPTFFLTVHTKVIMHKSRGTLSFYNNEPSKNKQFLILLSNLARNSQEHKLKRILEIP